MTNNDERPADLLFWFRDGHCGGYKARVTADVEVSIGRTNSKRALGFLVMKGEKTVIDFVLDRGQVAELAAFLQGRLPGLRKPLGRKQNQMSLVTTPKRRLHMALESAAMRAHGGYRRHANEPIVEIEEGAPSGTRLVVWFKKNHPRAAARIEREFTKKLWEGG